MAAARGRSEPRALRQSAQLAQRHPGIAGVVRGGQRVGQERRRAAAVATEARQRHPVAAENIKMRVVPGLADQSSFAASQYPIGRDNMADHRGFARHPIRLEYSPAGFANQRFL
jgi:hypothetical protein